MRLWPKREPSWLADTTVEPVLVTLDDDRTVAGLLADATEGALVLSHARLVDPHAGVVPLQGELVVPRDRVLLVQRGIRIDDAAALAPAREAA